MRIKFWFMAVFQDHPFWRVTYKDGKRTHPLYYAEAKGLKEVFDGELWIDYDYAKSWGKSPLDSDNKEGRKEK